ncbi:hypothetical protein PVAR5_1118 [Paecilomyces variotii No. 5]|uniref:Uncharacterized protein n=1 Tax=Byssochlamys spectabilis (strain No. 5 / NBRC 109023) TaxID=1356009 RepID=V5HSU3_BYSSN|nr:hypothetical protein PVAR5_1118 [Paecilomyces variotii No. 5]
MVGALALRSVDLIIPYGFSKESIDMSKEAVCALSLGPRRLPPGPYLARSQQRRPPDVSKRLSGQPPSPLWESVDASPRDAPAHRNGQSIPFPGLQHSGTALLHGLCHDYPAVYHSKIGGDEKHAPQLSTATRSPQTRCLALPADSKTLAVPVRADPAARRISDSSKMYSQRTMSTLPSPSGLVSASTYSSKASTIDAIHPQPLRWSRMTGPPLPLDGPINCIDPDKRCLGGEETFCLKLALKDPWFRLSLFDVTPQMPGTSALPRSNVPSPSMP